MAIVDGKLTGEVVGNIVNATAKAEFVAELCEQYQVSLSQVIVAGDGANDLEMMAVAGLSIAYYAKPAVIKVANVVVNYGNLDIIKDFYS
ncbi:Phosphoserine phosphatase [hydrothermal vent metagenome]|uniref:phosphoserine phosphatase n=1 Tax=hydrothermal vent metagenome TaxID=652676 RepID=A0A1W1DXB8_9ZZZZ